MKGITLASHDPYVGGYQRKKTADGGIRNEEGNLSGTTLHVNVGIFNRYKNARLP